jgi:arylsulfatase A-like enzyme
MKIDCHGRPPNILYVFADQLALQHCGYAGARQAKTPNIDRFATRAVDCRNMIASTPVCAASRASLFTGKYTTSTGMVINELRMNTRHAALGHVLTAGGYDTCYIGKWHLYANQLWHHDNPKNSFVPPGPDRLGFDGYWAGCNFNHNSYAGYYHENSIEKIPYAGYEPDIQTDMMIRWLEERHVGKERGGPGAPFAAVLSWGPPHDPWTDDNVPEEYRSRFADENFPNPPNYLGENDPYADQWARLSPEEREQLPHWRRNYYAMTANLDWNFGRLLEALQRLGLEENTLVVFSSDHGECFGAHGRRAKNTFYEEACRVPFLIRCGGHTPQGLRLDACLTLVDVMPTLLGLAGLPIPAETEGMDASHLVLGQAGPEPDAALMQNTGACADWIDGHEWRALRDQRHTYAIYRRDGSELLFDNLTDPHQMKNLAAEEGSRPLLETFRARLKGKMAAINDTFECCTWYRDHWIEDRNILRTATLK